MNHHRQLDRTRQTQLPAEHFPLHLSGRVVVVIVKPDLSPGDYAPTLLDKVEELLFRNVIKEPGIVWMHSNGCIDVLVPLSQADCPLKRAALRIAGPDVEHRRDPALAGTRDYFFAIGIVLSAVDMAM